MTDGAPTEAELIALGLYDPSAEHAAERLELIRYLSSVGATLDDMIEYRDELPGVGTVVSTRPGLPRYTGEEIAAKTDMSEEFLLRLWRAAGFPEVATDVVAFSEADLEMLRLISGARSLFGEDAVMQLTRVIGSSLAKIADAVVSAFLVNIEVPIVEQDPAGLAVAQANVAATALLPGLSRAMDILLRRHILAGRRSLRALQETGAAGFEVQDLAVGFVDLVGSTALTQQLAVGDLGRALSEFETRVADSVVEQRGRVVKLIGDEVMFVAPGVALACEIALDVADAFAAHPVLPPVRAGIAAGEVLTRDGDYFGPVVNLAARLVKAAEPGTVTVSDTARPALEAAGFRCEPTGTHALKGIEPAVALITVTRA
jgi:adenylate cyclase